MNCIAIGSFDIFHYGHVCALEKCKRRFDKVFACMQGTSTQSIQDSLDSVFILQNCRFVDGIIMNPEGFNDLFTTPSKNSSSIPNTEMSVVWCETDTGFTAQGVSLDNVLYRCHCLQNDLHFRKNLDVMYLKHVFAQVCTHCQVISPENDGKDELILINGTWDILTRDILQRLLEIKQQSPRLKLICRVLLSDDTNTLLNTFERAITLASITIVDLVLIEGMPEDEAFMKNIHNYQYEAIDLNDDAPSCWRTWDLTSSTISSRISLELDKRRHHEHLKRIYLDTGLYMSILGMQLCEIHRFLKETTFTDNDIVVFDIDEVCLVNLMYTNDFHYDHVYLNQDIFSYATGMNPVIEDSKPLFDNLHARRVNYAFVTGRREWLRKMTIANLELAGYIHYKELYMCPDDYQGNMTEFKTLCRNDLAKTYNIVCSIGDQASDVRGDHSGTPFLLFNPFYHTP